MELAATARIPRTREDLPLAGLRPPSSALATGRGDVLRDLPPGDSLPQAKLRELRHLRATWLRQHPPPHADEALQQLSREVMQRVERWLDQGMGDCVLRQRDLAQNVLDGLHRFDGERYKLDVYVAMPNHVHAVVRPFADETEPLESILQCWKRCSATKINKRRTTRGSLWQEESFDRIIRDEEHLYRVIQYIGVYLKKGGFLRDDCPVWDSSRLGRAGMEVRVDDSAVGWIGIPNPSYNKVGWDGLGIRIRPYQGA